MKEIFRFESITSRLVDKILESTIRCSKHNSLREFAVQCQMERIFVKKELSSSESWSFQIEDSHGKESSGRLQDRRIWYGEYDQCYSVYKTVNITGENEMLKGFYVLITAKGKRPDIEIDDYFTTGFCALPKCRKFMENALKYKIKNESCEEQLSEGEFKMDNIKIPLRNDASGLAGIIFFSIFFSLVIGGTFYDHFSKKFQSTNDKQKVNGDENLTATVALQGAVLPIFKYGPGVVELKTIGQEHIDPCRKTWWRNLLFIHNFFPQEEMCAVATWYISCDVQIYFALSIGLFLYIVQGCPRTASNNENKDRVIALIRDNRRISQAEISQTLNIGHAAVEDLISSLGMRQIVSRWIPYQLDWYQKDKRV
ncbi:DgyrCDS14584 [Dimorphilus gyrociliatus]|uniref:DgyrCDS14584 n=1 Tax=Dimorphilus gyrociliatus TaxID=2664684 RepID=A0A7I8WE42_9ANNE|nr:DgyrCDS14584 [Dimorphilus gyrociliatus]